MMLNEVSPRNLARRLDMCVSMVLAETPFSSRPARARPYSFPDSISANRLAIALILKNHSVIDRVIRVF